MNKTSKEWYDEIPKEFKFQIMDPDGWDRRNFEYSFFEELITKTEFIDRVSSSTVIMTSNTNEWFINWIGR